jgi:hypothetical protein
MINELRSADDLKGSECDLIEAAFLAFACSKDEEGGGTRKSDILVAHSKR